MTAKILVRTAEGVLQEYPLGASLRVGSGPPSDLVIEGDGVLAEHAKVGVTEQGGWIEAVGGSRVSINGEPADRRALRHLDVITLGDQVHAIFLASPGSLSHASRARHAASPGLPPAVSSPYPASNKTIVGLPSSALFTPPVDDQPASSPRTVVGLPVAGVFTPPVDDQPAAAPTATVPVVPSAMPGESSTRTVTGLPASALNPPRFDAPPSQTIKIAPVAPPSFTPGERAMHPIQSVRLSGADGIFDAPLGVSVIGRGSKSTLRIDSVKISRVHAVIIASRDHVTVEDQGSANGTAVNGVRIKGRHPLADGDVLSLGSVDLRVTFIRHAGDI